MQNRNENSEVQLKEYATQKIDIFDPLLIVSLNPRTFIRSRSFVSYFILSPTGGSDILKGTNSNLFAFYTYPNLLTIHANLIAHLSARGVLLYVVRRDERPIWVGL